MNDQIEKPRLNPYSAAPEAAPVAAKSSTFWILLILAFLVAGIAGMLCGSAVGLVIGGMAGQGELYESQYLSERNLVEPILERDSAFQDIQVERKSNGGVSLLGNVPTQEDHQRLHKELQDEFGRSRALELMAPISVGPPPH